VLSDNETLVTKPDTTTIFGAVKLTGKTSRWNYGALTAVTSREDGIVDATSDAESGATFMRRERKVIEPRSVYSVARVSRNLLGDTSNVGVIATNVTRELDADASLAGVDATLRRDRNRFNLNGHAVATHAPIDGRRAKWLRRRSQRGLHDEVLQRQWPPGPVFAVVPELRHGFLLRPAR
jgi:hypothetical protein